MNEHDSVESRLSKVETEVSSLVNSVNKFIDVQQQTNQTLFKEIKSISNATNPNWQTMAAWAAVIVSVLGLFGAIVGFGIMRELDRAEKANVSLDTKLQSEYGLIEQKLREEISASIERSNERDNSIIEQVKDVKRFQQDQVKADLDELRDWRTGVIHYYKGNAPLEGSKQRDQ